MGRNWLRRVIVEGPTTITGGRDGELRIQFKVTQWHSGTPNMGSIIVTNPSFATVSAWKNKVGSEVTLSCGYEDHYGVIFKGEIKQVVYQHEENNVDTSLIIYCADKDQWYRKGIITLTLGKGYTPQDKINAVLDVMRPFGITLGVSNIDLSHPVYPRGTPLIGLTRDILRQTMFSVGGLWSVQMGKLMLTKNDLDTGNSSAIKLTAETGLVSYPRQTDDGITFRSLINSALQPLCKVTLDPSKIIEAERDNNPFSGDAIYGNLGLELQRLAAGTYTVYVVQREGDTRSQTYYDDCICIGEGGLPTQSLLKNYYAVIPQ